MCQCTIRITASRSFHFKKRKEEMNGRTTTKGDWRGCLIMPFKCKQHIDSEFGHEINFVLSFSPSTGGILSGIWQHFWVPFLSCVSGWAQRELICLHAPTYTKAQPCKSAVAGLLEGQYPQLLPEAEFRRSQRLSGSWKALSYKNALDSLQTPEKLRDLVSLKVRFGLFKRQTAPLLCIFHYLEFTQKQEQLDFTQTYKLTVLCCVAPAVFLKIPSWCREWDHALVSLQPFLALAPFPSLFCQASTSQVYTSSFLPSTAANTAGIFPTASTLSSFLFPSSTCTPQCVLTPGLQTGLQKLCFH